MQQVFPFVFRGRVDFPNEGTVDRLSLLFFDASTDEMATRRALKLLYRVLSPLQRWELERCGWFMVAAPGWGRFQILPRSIFNVLSLETGIAYCATTPTPVPVPDLMLAHKLCLEQDPDRFFSVANRRHPDGGRICWPGN